MAKNAKLNKFLQDMEKKFGKNVVRIASEIKAESMKRVSTGSLGLDIDTGGGYPVGRFIHTSGAFSSTKSTTTYHGMANFQKYFKSIKSDLKVALIQGENGSWTDEYGRGIGIDTDDLLINECASMEEALEIAVQLQRREIAGLIVFDSLAALVPMKEDASNMEDSVQMGLKPKLFDEYFRKFQASNNLLSRQGKHVCTVIGINQLREKIGAYGDPEYSPGGRAISFTASLEIRLRRGEFISKGTGQNKQIIGQQVKYKIAKSKVSTPLVTGDWDFYLDEGGPVPTGHMDTFKELIILAISYGVVEMNGAYLKYGDMEDVGGKAIQGKDKFIEYLRERPELSAKIREETLNIGLSKAEEEFEEFKENLTEEQLSNLEEYGTIEAPELEAEDEEAVVEEKPKKSSRKKKTAKAENSRKKVAKK